MGSIVPVDCWVGIPQFLGRGSRGLVSWISARSASILGAEDLLGFSTWRASESLLHGCFMLVWTCGKVAVRELHRMFGGSCRLLTAHNWAQNSTYKCDKLF